MALSVVILAAGQGKRMHSKLPKVLQPLGGKTLLEHVVDTARAAGGERLYVVYGYGGERVPAALPQLEVNWVRQEPQLGTGHALAQALPQIPDAHTVLVLCGDVPLVRPATLQPLIEAAGRGALAVLTARVTDPSGYGRVLRNPDGRVERVVEDRDAQGSERSVKEINTGLLAASARHLRAWLKELRNHNAQGEYYLTDVVALAVAAGVVVQAVAAEDAGEVLGVNDKLQLAAAEAALRRRRAEALMRSGVTLCDPERFDLRGTLECGRDVVIDVNCLFAGTVRLGDRVRIGPGAVISDCEIGDDSEVFACSVLEGAKIGARVRIGPFARIRPESTLADAVHVGNFVEVKKSSLGAGSKANHLAYVGDAEIGREVNVGAGTITCNYDGAGKHRTVIGDGAFIGSNTSLVAPVEVGPGATIGAGSVITRDAPGGELTVARARQVTVPGWKRPQKK